MSAFRVGLTGGLASGKSTVARRLAAAGLTVVDADRLVAELYRAGQPGAAAVADALGREFLTADGAVDKGAVARLVFSDRAALERLESAVHPLVAHRFAEIAAATEGVAVLEATKLVETGLDETLDFIVTVEAPAEVRLHRAIARGLSESAARARLAAQDDGTRRRERADVVIENGGNLRELARQTDALLARLRERAG